MILPPIKILFFIKNQTYHKQGTIMEFNIISNFQSFISIYSFQKHDTI